jgi:hypothetical protein
MQRENPHLFPNTFYTPPLETWAAAIQRLSSEAEQCFLEEVVHCKALSDMEHEFLVVSASHPSGSKIVLGIDRNARDLATAACGRTPGSASQDTDTTQPSTVASSWARYLNTLVCAKSLPPSSSTSRRRNHRTSRTMACKSRTTAPLRPSSPSTGPVSRSSISPFHPPPLLLPRPPLPPHPLPTRTQGVLHPYYTSPSSYSRSAHASHPTTSSDTNVISSRARHVSLSRTFSAV